MSVNFFASTWSRAEKKRKSHGFQLNLSMYPSFEPCRLDPTIPNAHPAFVFEASLLRMSDDDFRNCRPSHLDRFESDKPFKTGVKWIDEQEESLYARDRD